MVFDLYGDIARRTNGDIYIGIVGPMRTGKSTFLSRFMQTMVLPNMQDDEKRKELVDEMPVAGAGKTVTTVEPKFVPKQGATVIFGVEREVAKANIRMVDCVGYVVEGALGVEENGVSRKVKTAWKEEEMPFGEAAELGTQKVICDHATVGVLVTTDGSFTDIARKKYVPAEERVVEELKKEGKPFVILLNSARPEEESAKNLRAELEEKYGVPVLLFSATQATEEDFSALMERLLYEFPLTKVDFNLPAWMQTLPEGHPLIEKVLREVKAQAQKVGKMRDYTQFEEMFREDEVMQSPTVSSMVPATGSVECSVGVADGVFYRVLSEECGDSIECECDLMNYCQSLANAKREYQKLKQALSEVQEKGYGVVIPKTEDMQFEEPVLVHKGGGYGVKIKATAPSLHIMRVDVSTEINPIVGTEEQSREMVDYLKQEYEENPKAVFETNLFGKSVQSLITEGLDGKITAMPEDMRKKMRKTVTRIVNEGKGGVLCILL